MFKDIKSNIWLLLILAMGAILRIYNIRFQSLWIDELHTLIESSPAHSFEKFHLIMMIREGMGHLYFLLLKYSYAIFGYTPVTARMFSAIVGIASIYVIYLIGKLLYNKRLGLIAALILSVNYFHIYYSQEARPYVLLVLFTLLSFYRLILFLKKSNWKNAIYYGIFSGLIVHAQFVGLLTLFSQGLLILFVVYAKKPEERLKTFLNGLLAGVVALGTMAPTYLLFKKMMGYKSGWLTLPGPDGFTNIFKMFLGNTELLYMIFTLLIVFYFVRLFQQKDIELHWSAIYKNKLVFSGLLLFTWVFFSIWIAIIKSYTSESMILDRYFIGLLPAFILAVAIGVYLIKNRIVRSLVLTVIVLFSIVDITIVKKYYSTVTKPQFREITTEIKKNNPNNHKVVSAYRWLFGYYFDKEIPIYAPDEYTLENYVEAMRNGSVVKESFWYMDGNFRPYVLGPNDEAFLNEHFVVQENYMGYYNTWAKHYIKKE